MSSNLFNENMTSKEARTVLFRSVEGKTKTEIEQIKAEYSKLLPKIIDREMALAKKGWIFN